MTPRTTVLVLLGVADKIDAQCRLQITVGYLTAVLSQCDLAKAPTLEDLLGDSDSATAANDAAKPVPEQEDPRDNVRAWIAALGGATTKPESEEESDG